MPFLKEEEIKKIEKKLKDIAGANEELPLEKTRKQLGIDYPKLSQFAMQTDQPDSMFEFDFKQEKIRKKKKED